jgi:ribosomal protein S18 acetylase RimI-like enzyme
VDKGRKVGFAVTVLSRHWADKTHTQGVIGEVFIHPEYRREGQGRRLTQALVEWLKTNGAADIQSGVVAGNVRGLRFWEAMGFQIVRYTLQYRPDQPREPEEED